MSPYKSSQVQPNSMSLMVSRDFPKGVFALGMPRTAVEWGFSKV